MTKHFIVCAQCKKSAEISEPGHAPHLQVGSVEQSWFSVVPYSLSGKPLPAQSFCNWECFLAADGVGRMQGETMVAMKKYERAYIELQGEFYGKVHKLKELFRFTGSEAENVLPGEY